MKKILTEKSLAFFLLLTAFFISTYLYQQGKISFSAKKNDYSALQSMTVEVPFTEKEYKLSYADRPLSLVREVARFEDDEDWVGDGELNFSSYFEGESSLILSSQNHSRSVASLVLREGVNFDDFLNYKVFIESRSEFSDDVEEFNLFFLDEKSGNGYKYPIRDLSSGWDLLVLPKEKFSIVNGGGEGSRSVNKIVIELISRPKTAASVNIDFMWAEKDENYLEDWVTDHPRFLFLKKNMASLGLAFVNISGNSVASIKRITSARDYMIIAKFTPLRPGNFGFFLRGDSKSKFGYYLVLDGIDSAGWSISKAGIFEGEYQTLILAKGTISNFKIEEGEAYWLKVTTEGIHLWLHLSFDGLNYTKLGEVNDDSFPFGGIGIVSGSSMLFIDDIQFSQ